MKNVIALWLTGHCILIAVTENRAGYQMSVVQTGAESQIIFNNAARDEDYTYNRGLTERSISTAKKGLLAMEKLLMGAKKVQTNKRARFYRKNGNRQTALADFYSVKPAVTRPNMNTLGNRRLGERLIGSVGNRRLILMLDGDYHRHRSPAHSPVLEIQSTTDDLRDVIVYTMEQ